MKYNQNLRDASKVLSDMNKLYMDDTEDVKSDMLIREIEISQLDDYPNNHFHHLDGEEWDEFVGSIKEVGIITPLVVRAVGTRYEILAGHNRKKAALEAGLSKVPCRVIEADDVESSVIVAITNRQREQTTDLEWGWAYRTTYEALKRSVGRHKKEAENDDCKMVPTVGTISEGTKTRDIVAEKYGVSKNTVDRKIRLTYLIPELYEYGSRTKMSQKVLIELSYLTDREQRFLLPALAEKKSIMTDETAAGLRALSDQAKNESRELTMAEIYDLIQDEGETAAKPVVRVKKYQIEDSYFPAALKKSDREEYVIKALRYIKENEIEL